MNNQVLPAGSRVRVISYGPFRALKGTIRKVDAILGLEAGEALCFYLFEPRTMLFTYPKGFVRGECERSFNRCSYFTLLKPFGKSAGAQC